MVARVVLLLALVLLVHSSRGENLQSEWSSWGVGLLQGRRLEMEDRAAVLQKSCSAGSEQQHRLWAVYDGHGGSWIAQALSEQLLPAVQSALCNITPPTSAPAAFMQSHSQANNECQDTSKANHDLPAAAGIVQPHVQPAQVSQVLTQQFAAVDEVLLQVATQQHCFPPSQQQQDQICAANTDAGSTALVLLLTALLGQAGDMKQNNQAQEDKAAEPAGETAAQTGPAHRWSLLTASVGNSRAVLCRKQADTSTPTTADDVAGVERGTEGRLADDDQQKSSRRAAVLKALRRRQHLSHSASDETPTAAAGPWEAITLNPLHEAGNAEEVMRVTAAGGSITQQPSRGVSIPRLAGELEVTRAFGDVSFRSQGLIAVPDVSHHILQPGDQVVVLASDGVFEVMTPQQVCDHAAAQLLGLSTPARTPPAPAPIVLPGDVSQAADDLVGQQKQRMSSSIAAADSSSSSSGHLSGSATMDGVAARIIHEAYDKGSGDNLAVIAIDLRSFMPSLPSQQQQQQQEEERVQQQDVAPHLAALQDATNTVVPISEAHQHAQRDDTSLALRECLLLPYDGAQGSKEATFMTSWQESGLQQGAQLMESEQQPGHPLSLNILKRAGHHLLKLARSVWQAASAMLFQQHPEQQQQQVTAAESAVEGGELDVLPVHVGTLLSCPVSVDGATSDGPQGDVHMAGRSSGSADYGCRFDSSIDSTGLCTQTGWSQYQLTDMFCHTPRDWHEGHYHWYASLRLNTGPPLLQLAGAEQLVLSSGETANTQPAAEAGCSQELQHSVPSSTHVHHHNEQQLDHRPSAYMSHEEEGWMTDTAADWWGQQTYMWDTEGAAAGAGAGVQAALAGAAEEGTTLSDMAFIQELQQQYLSAAATHEAAGGRMPAVSKSFLGGVQVPASTHALRPSLSLGAPAAPPASHAPPPPSLTTSAMHVPGSNSVSSSSPDRGVSGEHLPLQLSAARSGRVLLMDDDAEDVPMQQHAAVNSVSSSSQQPTDSPYSIAGTQAGTNEEHNNSEERDQGIQSSAHGQQILSGTSLQATGMASGGQHVITRSPRYQLDRKFGAGHFGEVWFATVLQGPERPHHHTDSMRHGGMQASAAGAGAAGQQLVLKRVFAERGAELYQAGLREAYFGQLLSGHLTHQERREHVHPVHPGLAHMVQFVEAFYTHRIPSNTAANSATSRKARASHASKPRPADAAAARDLWLVYQHAGKSLHDLMYEPLDAAAASPSSSSTSKDETGCGSAGFQVMGPSRWWWGMRQASQDGTGAMQQVLKQLLLGLDALQSLNITHRDIKTDNLMLQRCNESKVQAKQPPLTAAGPFSWQGDEHLRIIDFGSALDSHTLSAGMWGNQGPGATQTTAEYAPPEALFARFWEGTRAMRPSMWAYDMWSVGVVWLEMLLGTPDVWALPASTRALLDARLSAAGRPTEERATAYLLRGLQQWCISPPSRQRTATQQESAATDPVAGSQLSADKGSQPVQASARRQAGLDAAMAARQAASVNADTRSMVSWACSDRAVLELIKARDPAGLGLGSNMAAVNLLRSLLAWSPAHRPTAHEALAHPYFAAAGTAAGTPASQSSAL